MKSDGEKSLLNIAIREIRSSIEEKFGKPLHGRGVFVWCLVAHVSTNVSRMKVGTDGLAHYERLKGKSSRTSVLPVGKSVLSWTKMS